MPCPSPLNIHVVDRRTYNNITKRKHILHSPPAIHMHMYIAFEPNSCLCAHSSLITQARNIQTAHAIDLIFRKNGAKTTFHHATYNTARTVARIGIDIISTPNKRKL